MSAINGQLLSYLGAKLLLAIGAVVLWSLWPLERYIINRFNTGKEPYICRIENGSIIYGNKYVDATSLAGYRECQEDEHFIGILVDTAFCVKTFILPKRIIESGEKDRIIEKLARQKEIAAIFAVVVFNIRNNSSTNDTDSFRKIDHAPHITDVK